MSMTESQENTKSNHLSPEKEKTTYLRNFTHITIPAEIWLRRDISRSLLEKLINHYYFHKPLEVSDWVELTHLGLARKSEFSSETIADKIKRKTSQKVHKSLGLFIYECEWCHGTTFCLHAHHFPIRKEHGGKNTVNICASCHAEYHFIESYSYTLTNKTFQMFKEVE